MNRPPLAPISPNTIQTRSSTRKRNRPVEPPSPQIEVAADDPAEVAAEDPQSKSSEEVDSHDMQIVQSAIQKAMAERENGTGVISIHGVDALGRKTTHYFLPLPKSRKRRATSKRSIRDVARERAAKLPL